jgi:hypothetical protein
MKLRFIYVLFFALFALVVLQSRSGGAAAVLNQDRTGSPLSSGTCAACHSGGVFGTAISITVKNTGGTAVTSYIPGVTYSVEFNVTSGTGFTYAMQGVALNTANTQAGSFGIPTSTNTQVTTLNGRQYLEHSSPATGSGNFTFIAPWVAPVTGTGSVNFYGIGLTANGNGGTSGDQASLTTTISLSEAALPTSIDYINTTYCENSTNPTPTVIGTSGGTFTASPAGLSINASSGEVNLSLSTPGGPYTITYTYGGGSTTSDAFSVLPTDNAQFTFGGNTWCQNDLTDPSPQGGPFAGTWSGSTGLVINGTTGVIDLSASTAIAHTVTYTTNGACPNSDNLSITINVLDNAQFTLGAATFCQNSSDVTPVSGIPGGIWTGTTGLVLSSMSGTIDVSASTPGAHTITYTTSGLCPTSSDTVLTILAPDVASFAFADTVLCISPGSGQNVSLTVSGTTSGTYTASPAGLIFANSTTGEIDVNSSLPATYTLTYISNGPCPTTATTNANVTVCSGNLTILDQEDEYAIAPNPNNGLFNVLNNGEAGVVSIQVLDVLGKVVYQQETSFTKGGYESLQLTNLTAGTYFVQLVKNNELKTIKMTVN